MAACPTSSRAAMPGGRRDSGCSNRPLHSRPQGGPGPAPRDWGRDVRWLLRDLHRGVEPTDRRAIRRRKPSCGDCNPSNANWPTWSMPSRTASRPRHFSGSSCIWRHAGTSCQRRWVLRRHRLRERCISTRAGLCQKKSPPSDRRSKPGMASKRSAGLAGHGTAPRSAPPLCATPRRHGMIGLRRTQQHLDRQIRLAWARRSANGLSRDVEDGDHDDEARSQPARQPRGLPDEES